MIEDIMNNPKVSVIVPVYNAGHYLNKCLDSLVAQTLKDIEIILVLDCPTDGSEVVAKEYAARYTNIKVLYNKTNLHVGLSRNRGLEIAKGEYIAFSDHDDYCESDMFERMYQKALETEAEVVVSDYYGERGEYLKLNKFPRDGSDEEFRIRSFRFLISWPIFGKSQDDIVSNGLIWNQMYKRSFLEQNHICFLDNRKFTFEDRTFLIQVYYFARRVVRIPQAFYYHVYLVESEGKSYRFKSVELVINYLLFVKSFLKKQNILEQEQMYFSEGVLLCLYTSFCNELKNKSVRLIVKKLRQIRADKELQSALRFYGQKGNLHHLKKYPCTKIIFWFLVTSFPKWFH